SLFIVTALTLPTANQPGDRDAGTRRALAGINGISAVPTEVLAELNRFDELNDEQKYAATEKLRSAVRNSEFHAEKLAATDPESALAIINMTDGIVEDSKVDPEVTRPLRKALAKSRDNIEFSRKINSPRIGMANRKKEVEETIKREEHLRGGIKQDFVAKV